MPPVPPRWPPSRKPLVLESRWTVTSYTGIAKAAAELDRDEKLRRTDAEAQGSELPRLDDHGGRTSTSLPKPPLEEFEFLPRLSEGAGTLFGTFVHEVFEAIDFQVGASDGIVAILGQPHGFAETSSEVHDLARHLPNLLTTPLDAAGASPSPVVLPSGFSLSSLGRADRVDELSFDLRLGHGTHFHAERTDFRKSAELDAFAGCLDPKRVYEALLSEPETKTIAAWLDDQRRRYKDGRAILRSMAGILTGSIDLVFRVQDGSLGRYFVVDYKTNRIETSEAGHYAGAWLDWKMASSGYTLQSLLYNVALHRHLSLRVGSGYRYEDHFGGVLYLFLRGMAGPSTPRDSTTGHCLGVHAHRWSPTVIQALDEALSPSEDMAS